MSMAMSGYVITSPTWVSRQKNTGGGFLGIQVHLQFGWHQKAAARGERQIWRDCVLAFKFFLCNMVPPTLSKRLMNRSPGYPMEADHEGNLRIRCGLEGRDQARPLGALQGGSRNNMSVQLVFIGSPQAKQQNTITKHVFQRCLEVMRRHETSVNTFIRFGKLGS